jgi:hypothetical protein
MRARWTVTLGAGLALLLGGATGAAHAEPPATLGEGYVYDGSDVLTSSEEAQANERLAQLADETDLQLWVVYVDDFENPSEADQWANATADQNGLGTNQYLLAISTEGRNLFLSAPPNASLSDSRLTAIEDDVITALGGGDWIDAVDAAASGFERGDGNNGAVWGGIVVLVLAAGVVIAVVVLRSRKKKGGAAQADPEVPIEELRQRAATLLVEADIRSSEQDLGFAVAQFGEDATAGFKETLDAAKANVSRAFDLKRQLDDDQPDTPEQIRAWTTEIIQLCEQAEAALDEKAQTFEELRHLEQNAPEALGQVMEKRAQAAGYAAEGANALATLAERYAPGAFASVADNPQQIEKRLAFADEQIAAAQQAIGAGQGGEAAVGIRNAEQALAQAHRLDTSISELAASLAEGERQAAELIAELEGDLATARALPDADGTIAGAIALTQQQVDQAKQNLAGPGRRPLLMLEALQKADAEIDRAVASGRDAAERTRRAEQMLSQTILQARSQVHAAEEYVSMRRGGVGADARTRLAQAQTELQQAESLRAADPANAVAHAQSALQLAQHAMSLAQNDLNVFDTRYSSGGSGGDSFAAGLLGGLLGSSLGGGRNRSSGWGGSSWSGGSSRGSGWSGGGRSGRSGGSSFGGGRSGRSGGRSFGGGGGRSGRSGGRRF